MVENLRKTPYTKFKCYYHQEFIMTTHRYTSLTDVSTKSKQYTCKKYWVIVSTNEKQYHAPNMLTLAPYPVISTGWFPITPIHLINDGEMFNGYICKMNGIDIFVYDMNMQISEQDTAPNVNKLTNIVINELDTTDKLYGCSTFYSAWIDTNNANNMSICAHPVHNVGKFEPKFLIKNNLVEGYLGNFSNNTALFNVFAHLKDVTITDVPVITIHKEPTFVMFYNNIDYATLPKQIIDQIVMMWTGTIFAQLQINNNEYLRRGYLSGTFTYDKTTYGIVRSNSWIYFVPFDELINTQYYEEFCTFAYNNVVINKVCKQIVYNFTFSYVNHTMIITCKNLHDQIIQTRLNDLVVLHDDTQSHIQDALTALDKLSDANQKTLTNLYK